MVYSALYLLSQRSWRVTAVVIVVTHDWYFALWFLRLLQSLAPCWGLNLVISFYDSVLSSIIFVQRCKSVDYLLSCWQIYCYSICLYLLYLYLCRFCYLVDFCFLVLSTKFVIFLSGYFLKNLVLTGLGNDGFFTVAHFLFFSIGLIFQKSLGTLELSFLLLVQLVFHNLLLFSLSCFFLEFIFVNIAVLDYDILGVVG